jgi:hypothetical protein
MIMVMTGQTDVRIAGDTGEPSHDEYYTGIGRPIAAGSPVVSVRGHDAYLDPSLMKVDQAYVYRLDGSEFIAIKRGDGRVAFYALPDR